MSEENVELVRGLYEMGDFLDATPELIDRAFREDLDEQFEFGFRPDYPEGEPVFRGRQGIAELRAMLRDTWTEWRVEPERYLDAGKRVVVYRVAPWPWVGRARTDRVRDCAPLDDRAGRATLFRSTGIVGSPRSRRAAGVGDVGEERGGGTQWIRSVQPSAISTGEGTVCTPRSNGNLAVLTPRTRASIEAEMSSRGGFADSVRPRRGLQVA